VRGLGLVKAALSPLGWEWRHSLLGYALLAARMLLCRP
jgi:hypothetical protein